MTIDEANFKVMTYSPLCSSQPPDETTTNSYNKSTKQEHKMKEKYIANESLNTSPIVFNTGSKSHHKTLTLIDSGASDHCFTNKESFI